jgi:hypothetical protein
VLRPGKRNRTGAIGNGGYSGAVAGAGDHPALLARQGIYAELFTLQAEGYLGR